MVAISWFVWDNVKQWRETWIFLSQTSVSLFSLIMLNCTIFIFFFLLYYERLERWAPDLPYTAALLSIHWYWWSFLCQDLEEKIGYLPGDCLIAAAFLSYMGPFLSNYREDIVQKVWMAEVRMTSLIFSPLRQDQGDITLFAETTFSINVWKHLDT